ncbi:MAG: hypothetical protein H6774_00015 [Pseudomonadales bacterium]|nr:hypothetical protein [Pseudomonadales bacterium]
MAEFTSPRAAEKAAAAGQEKEAAQQRSQERAARRAERGGKWRDRWNKVKETSARAWDAVGQAKDVAVTKAKAGAAEIGGAVADSRVADKVDSIQAGARSEVKAAQAGLIEKYNQATNGVARVMDAVDRTQEIMRAGAKAKAAEVVFNGVGMGVGALKALVEELNGMIAKMEAKENLEDGDVEPLMNKLAGSSGEARARQDKARETKEKAGALRNFFRRRGQ